jgi:pimeloyl-ACP methyl ester carboxylesterase
MKKKNIVRVLLILLVIYAIVGIYIYVYQESYFFRPDSISKDHQYSYDHQYDEYFIPISNEDTLHLLHVKTDSVKKGDIIFYHGNGGNAGGYYYKLRKYLDKGFDLWLPEYPGYGKSVGKYSQENFYEFSLQAYKFIQKHLDTLPHYIYGWSLGTGPASYVAQGSQAKHLILETPYANWVDLFQIHLKVFPAKMLCRYHFSVKENLSHVFLPVTIFIGSDDEVIPMKHSLALKEVLKPIDTMLILNRGTHTNLDTYSHFRSRMNVILQ